MKHFVRFCTTLEVLHFPLLGFALLNVLWTFHWFGTWLGVNLGIVLYAMVEAYVHRGMHKNRFSPFYYPHRNHHVNPTPETGVPRWWTFAGYALISYLVFWRQGAYLSGLWFGILIMLTVYEWVHFLCHCNYRPKTKWGWRVRVNHLQHHNFDQNSRYELLFLSEQEPTNDAD